MFESSSISLFEKDEVLVYIAFVCANKITYTGRM